MMPDKGLDPFFVLYIGKINLHIKQISRLVFLMSIRHYALNKLNKLSIAAQGNSQEH